jgi:hypothetical protein
MPGALIEPLFITDPFEASIADSARGQEVIARGIAGAVEQYFNAHRSRRGTYTYGRRGAVAQHVGPRRATITSLSGRMLGWRVPRMWAVPNLGPR